MAAKNAISPWRGLLWQFFFAISFLFKTSDITPGPIKRITLSYVSPYVPDLFAFRLISPLKRVDTFVVLLYLVTPSSTSIYFVILFSIFLEKNNNLLFFQKLYFFCLLQMICIQTFSAFLFLQKGEKTCNTLLCYLWEKNVKNLEIF